MKNKDNINLKKIGKKIGLFDSGFGGLTILRHFVKDLPEYDYIYLGDSLRAPYGEKSHEQIYEFTKEGVRFLFEQGAEIVILACNSASAQALRQIQKDLLPVDFPRKKVLGVIIPTVEEAVLKTKNKKIAILATRATINSNTFEREINKLDPQIIVNALSASLLVPMIESGQFENIESKGIIKTYVEEVMSAGADTLILGCTHYGILKNEIQKNALNVNVISEEEIVGGKLKDYLERHSEIENSLSKGGSVKFFTTGEKENFDKFGTRFFGSIVESEKIEL